MIFKKGAIEIHGFLLIFVYIKTYIMSIIFGVTLIVVALWITYEIWSAPLYDEDMNMIKPGKKLFKKNKQ